MNTQDTSSHNANKTYYIEMWKEMLKEFLGWPDSQVIRWVEEHIDLQAMDDPTDLYYHQTPQYWIRQLLVPESLQQRLSDQDLGYLKNDILEVFADEHHYHFPIGTDWRPFKEKLERLLGTYGEHLPVVEDGITSEQ